MSREENLGLERRSLLRRLLDGSLVGPVIVLARELDLRKEGRTALEEILRGGM